VRGLTGLSTLALASIRPRIAGIMVGHRRPACAAHWRGASRWAGGP